MSERLPRYVIKRALLEVAPIEDKIEIIKAAEVEAWAKEIAACVNALNRMIPIHKVTDPDAHAVIEKAARLLKELA